MKRDGLLTNVEARHASGEVLKNLDPTSDVAVVRATATLSHFRGLKLTRDSDNDPPEWLYLSNEDGEVMYVYVAHDMFFNFLTR